MTVVTEVEILNPDTSMGAVTLKVGDLNHHHIAMNTWNSRGTGPRAASLGLSDVAVSVPTAGDLDALIARLRAGSIPFVADGRSVIVTDPWNTQVTVALPDLSTEELVAR